VHSKTHMWNNHLTINEIPRWSKVCHQMPIPLVISILTPHVVMSNPLITQIKTKNWFVPFHVLSQQFFFNYHFLISYIFPILIWLLVILSTFKFWSMLLAIMRTTPRMKIFILGVKFCIQKSKHVMSKINMEIDNHVYHLNNDVII